MLKTFKYCFFLALFAATPSFSGTVFVASTLVGSISVNEVVEAQRLKFVPLGSFRAGDKIAVQVGARNAVFNDITACILSEEEARNYQSGGGCRGRIKTMTPFVLQWQVESESPHYVALDNRYANFIKKVIAVDVRYHRILNSDEMSELAKPFEAIRASIAQTFENADFNINIRPCGQSNAFSDNRTADITICSEMLVELQKNPGALTATLLHEYGHSLLNRWGEPGSNEEDMADQFATVTLLRAGDRGRDLLLQWIQYWTQRDSRAEAQTQLQRGDTHSLSIQRARNIQHAMTFPEEITRRWNKMMYRHMTRQALQQVINQPRRADDVDLAQEALRQK